jgi:hypothetical protein
MLRRMTDILFGQADAPTRIRAVRVSLGAAALRTLWHLPDGSFFEEHNETIRSDKVQSGRRIRLSRRQYDVLRTTGIVSTALWTGGVRHPVVRSVAAASFVATNAYVAHYHPRFWTYNSHLSLFVAVAAAADTRPAPGAEPSARTAQLQSLALASMQLGAATVYSQAGLSKLLHGGREWITTGRTVKGSLKILGTPHGERISENDTLMRALALATVVGEAALLPVVVARWQNRALIGVGAMAFHAATRRYLGISFWHLWCLYPALFIVPLPGDDRAGSAGHRSAAALVERLATATRAALGEAAPS